MASVSDLPLRYRLLLAAYPWRRLDPVPFAPLRKPLSQSRLALVTSAGLYRLHVDQPFNDSRGGDPTVRWLSSDTSVAELVVGQTSDAFDAGPVQRDINEAWPVDRMRDAAADGLIGSTARWHASFNGSMTAPGRFLRQSGPEIADRFRQDEVDAVLLVPV